MFFQRLLRSCFVYVALFVFLFAVTGHEAHAAYKKEVVATNVEVSDPIRDATVNVYCRLRNGLRTYVSSGSGVFIDPRGVILTNAHVAQYFLLASKEKGIKGRCSIRVGSPAKGRYEASVLYIPPTWILNSAPSVAKNKPKGTGENDFALLYITDAKRGELPLRFPALPLDMTGSISEGDEVTIAGYPSEDLSFNEITKKLKMVTASSAVTNTDGYSNLPPDLITLGPSDAAKEGVSGGPIVDSDHEVVGIATSKSTSKENRTLRAITSTYINRAIQIHTGASLYTLLVGDLAFRANISQATITPEMIKIVTSNLLRKKK